ncbi:MAG: cation:dicarboxylate symporter family transporter, partial [Luteitalea sp.]
MPAPVGTSVASGGSRWWLSAGPRAGPVLDFADAVAAITFRCTHYVMWLAPAAVLAALATTVATNGPHALSGLTRVV